MHTLSTALSAMLIVLIGWIITSCGGGYSDQEVEYQDQPAADPAFVAIQPVIARACGGCHNGSNQKAFDSAARFKGSKAKARLLAGTMPPAGSQISAADKKALLDYLGT